MITQLTKISIHKYEKYKKRCAKNMKTFKIYLYEVERDTNRSIKLIDYLVSKNKYRVPNRWEKFGKSGPDRERVIKIPGITNVVNLYSHPDPKIQDLIRNPVNYMNNHPKKSLIPLKNISFSQDGVYHQGIKNKLLNVDDNSNRGNSSPLPEIIKSNNKYYVWDGHHRVAAHIIQGKSHINAHLYDLDKSMSESHIFYSDSPAPFTGRGARYQDMDATKHYLNHYSNYVILSKIAEAPKDFNEKLRAEKEIKMAQKKMDYWTKHPNYDHKLALKGIEEIKNLWTVRPTGSSKLIKKT